MKKTLILLYVILNILVISFGIDWCLVPYFEGCLSIYPFLFEFSLLSTALLFFMNIAFIGLILLLHVLSLIIYRKEFFTKWTFRLLVSYAFLALAVYFCRSSIHDPTMSYYGFRHFCRYDFEAIEPERIEKWCQELGPGYRSSAYQESSKNWPYFFHYLGVNSVEVAPDGKSIQLYWGGGMVSGGSVILTVDQKSTDRSFRHENVRHVSEHVYFWPASEAVE